MATLDPNGWTMKPQQAMRAALDAAADAHHRRRPPDAAPCTRHGQGRTADFSDTVLIMTSHLTLKRLIQRQITDPLAPGPLESRYGEHNTEVKVGVEDGRLVLTRPAAPTVLHHRHRTLDFHDR